MDEVLLGKAAIIERCLRRVGEDYAGHEAEFATNFTRQDAIVLNLQRACAAAIDAAMHLVRRHALGIPTESREAFTMLVQNDLLTEDLGRHLQAMVGFHNIAVHNYSGIDWAIVHAIATRHLGDFEAFARAMSQDQV